jgi:hypothetical protein
MDATTFPSSRDSKERGEHVHLLDEALELNYYGDAEMSKSRM